MISSRREAIEQMREAIHQYEVLGRRVKGFEEQRERLMEQYNESLDYLVGETDSEVYNLHIISPDMITTKKDRELLCKVMFVAINKSKDVSIDEEKYND